jgi:hypothetical protein
MRASLAQYLHQPSDSSEDEFLSSKCLVSTGNDIIEFCFMTDMDAREAAEVMTIGIFFDTLPWSAVLVR